MTRETAELCLEALDQDANSDRRHHRRRARAEPGLPLARRAVRARAAGTSSTAAT